MNWKDIYPGITVYHKTFTHWGAGTVEKIVPVDLLTSMFERGNRRVLVKFEHSPGIARLQASSLRTKPNRKKIKEMIEFYAKRGLLAKDGGDRLILPGESE